MNPPVRYQALDGLRAAAILLVLSSHAHGRPGMPAYPAWWWHLGNLGVRLFFVLSGFIITHLLLRERDRRNRIDLRAFYIRRAFRILPPLFALMVLVGIGIVLGLWTVPLPQFVLALVFLANWPCEVGSWTIGHLWSLAVEEQFYLLWPPVMSLGLRRPGIRLVFIFASLILAPVLRVVGPFHSASDPTGFIENSDALAMGAFAAMLVAESSFGRLRKAMESVPSWVSGLSIMLLHLEPVPPALKVSVCYPLIHFSTAALILRVIRDPNDIGARVLGSRPFVFVGLISYSLYLFQQLAFNRPHPSLLPGAPWSILLAFAFASASHFLLEVPSMRWRERFLRRNDPTSTTVPSPVPQKEDSSS